MAISILGKKDSVERKALSPGGKNKNIGVLPDSRSDHEEAAHRCLAYTHAVIAQVSDLQGRERRKQDTPMLERRNESSHGGNG